MRVAEFEDEFEPYLAEKMKDPEFRAAYEKAEQELTVSDDPKPGCHLCPDDVPRGPLEILDHLRVLHPAEYGDGPERWPDGALVIEDDTLEPDDFNEEQG